MCLIHCTSCWSLILLSHLCFLIESPFGRASLTLAWFTGPLIRHPGLAPPNLTATYSAAYTLQDHHICKNISPKRPENPYLTYLSQLKSAELQKCALDNVFWGSCMWGTMLPNIPLVLKRGSAPHPPLNVTFVKGIRGQIIQLIMSKNKSLGLSGKKSSKRANSSQTQWAAVCVCVRAQEVASSSSHQ